MQTRVRRVGNSLGLVLPASVALEYGLHDGDSVEFEIRGRVPSQEEFSAKTEDAPPTGKLVRQLEAGLGMGRWR